MRHRKMWKEGRGFANSSGGCYKNISKQWKSVKLSRIVSYNILFDFRYGDMLRSALLE